MTLTAVNAIQAKPEVIFTSPCSCEGNHGVSRWTAKTDLAEPPASAANIKSLTPSQIYAWEGPGRKITIRSDRIPLEKNWYAVTGRINSVRIEDDGDLHIVLANVDGQSGSMVVELPLGPRWCEMRQKVFSWTDAHFPISSAKQRKLALTQQPIVTVIGKPLYDIDHSGKDTRNNRRVYDSSLAVWEIHPVMKLDVASTLGAPNPQLFTSPPALSPAPEQFVTITKPIAIQVPYGTTVLQPGMRLPILSQDSQTVDVRYLDARYTIPISSTNLR